MLKSDAMTVGLLIGGLLVTIAGVAVMARVGGNDIVIDAKLERACEREVAKRSPNGHRDLQTHSYRSTDDDNGILSGSVRSQYADDAWVPLSWACRVHADSGRVLKVEFEIQTSGSRLKAAARSF